ncbi:MAG: ACT domain-containing protein [Christensenellales bacterium]|nr:ACT domain-containing protein [Christensenellales bacterium]
MSDIKKAVVSVIGADRKGIIASVARTLQDYDVNILDISQTIVSGLFTMILIADISSEHCVFEALKSSLEELGKEMNLQIRVQRSEIFEVMHQI